MIFTALSFLRLISYMRRWCHSDYTLSMDPNLKMSIILFDLRYIRYKVGVKSQTWDSKVDLWLHRQVDNQL